ncbi:MAG: glycosyltransferase family 39 protein [candidate division KSB1 bacterium]|nr:glycosyltransferase family 39 protein [candidate division KSB1 bacterium]
MKRNDWIYLAIILIVAFAFRMLLALRFGAIGFDEVNYLKLAASGNIYGLNHVLHTYWSPFYPLVTALFSYIIPDYETAGRMVSVLSATFVLLPLFFFTRQYYSKKIAFGTIILTALFSFSAYFSAKAEADSLYSLISISSIVLGWSILKSKSVMRSIWLGILFGFAYLTRPEGIGLLIVFVIILLAIVLFHIIKRLQWKSYGSILILTFLMFVVTSLPYIIYLHQATGQWTISAKGAANQQGSSFVMKKGAKAVHPFHVLSEDNKTLKQDEIYHLGTFNKSIKSEGSAPIKVSVKDIAKKYSENIYNLFSEALPKLMPLPLILLLSLGLFAIPWKKEQLHVNLYILAFIVFFWFGVVPVFHVTLRYFIPLLPLIFIFLVSGIDVFSKWFEGSIGNYFSIGSRAGLIRIGGVSLAILMILVSSIIPEFGKRMRKNTFSTDEWAPCIEQKKAGKWLKQNSDEIPVVMAYNHAVSFYAGNYNIKESVEIPLNEIDRVMEYMTHRDVKYLVLNDRYRHKAPLISHLFDKRDVPSSLELVYEKEEKNGLRTLIYEINVNEENNHE